MTTIAWSRDSGVIAADRRCNYHNMTVSKLRRLVDDSVVGFSGNGAKCEAMAAYLTGHGEKPVFDKDDDTIEGLRVYPDGHVVKFRNNETPMPIVDPFFAIGSGSDYAMGAMAMGATPAEAIAVATRFDINTGNGVDTLPAPEFTSPED